MIRSVLKKYSSPCLCAEIWPFNRLHRGVFMLLLGMLALGTACGDLPHTDPVDEEQLSPLGPFDVPTPDPGPRFFPAPTGEYFDNPEIRVLHPDPEERLPLVLSDTVYWLDDALAATITAYGLEELKFPLAGNEQLLGYRPGHILMNRYLSIRHHINDIYIDGDTIVFDTRLADIEEIMLYGSIYFEAPPGFEMPIGHDAFDVYFFKSREHQEEAMKNKRIELEQIARDSKLRAQSQALKIRQQGIEVPCFDETVEDWETAYLSSSRPQFCKDIINDQGYYGAIVECEERVVNNLELFMPMGGACDPQFGASCPCSSLSTPQSCAQEICAGVADNRCMFDWEQCTEPAGEMPEPEDGDSQIKEVMNNGGGGGIGFSLSFCINTRTNPEKGERCPLCPDWQIPADELMYPWVDGQPNTSLDPLHPIYTFCAPETDLTTLLDEIGNLDNIPSAATAFLQVAAQVNTMIQNWKNLSTSEKTSQALSIVAGIINLIGSDKEALSSALQQVVQIQPVTGTDAPEGTLFEDFWPPMTCDCLPAFEALSHVWRVNTNLLDYASAGGGEGMQIGVGLYERLPISIGIDVFNLTISPIFMFTVGIKVQFNVGAFYAELLIGAYVGIGYGLNVALEVAQMDYLAHDKKKVYYSEAWGEGDGLVSFRILFLVVIIDPYFRTEFSGEATIGGSAEYDYYNEHWLYICFALAIGTKSSGIFTGTKARDRCDLPKGADDAYTNEFLESGLGLQAQVTALLALGVELRVAIGTAAFSEPGQGTRIWYEPMQVIAHLGVTLRRPYCYWEAMLKFGWEAGFALEFLGVGISKSKDGLYDGLGPYFASGTIEGWLFEMLFGCGDFPEIDPYSGDKDDCAIGEAGDDDCTLRYSNPDGDGDGDGIEGGNSTGPDIEARCFIRQCVIQDDMRVSLGWTYEGANLDLNIRNTSTGEIYFANGSNTAPNGSPYSGQFTRWSDGTDEDAGGRYIENFILSDPDFTNYEFWVTIQEGTVEPEERIPFTLEVEVGGPNPVREIFEGSTYLEHTSPSKQVSLFKLCLDPEDDQFCNQ